MKTMLLSLAPAVASLLTMVAVAWSAPAPQGEWVFTGQGVRVKKIAFMGVKVYRASHEMKRRPSQKSKRAVIEAETDKRITLTMLRDVDRAKLQDAMREGLTANGATDWAKIEEFVGALAADAAEGSTITITYDSSAKATTIVTSSGRATVAGSEFMTKVWSIWFGTIDQPGLGDEMIAKL